MLVRGVCHQCDDGITRPVIFFTDKGRKRFLDLRSDNSRLYKIKIYAPQT